MNEVINYQSLMHPAHKLPPHIRFHQYKELREKIKDYYDALNMPNKRNNFLKMRDKLLVDFTFATGGRIGDVVRVTKNDIDFERKMLNFNIKKTKIRIEINLDSDLCYDIMNYIRTYEIEDKLFKITTVAAWYVIRKLGKIINMEGLHPHMFRHGLAIHLLTEQVPIPIIQYRLGHRDIRTTIQMYMKITPALEKQMLESVTWR